PPVGDLRFRRPVPAKKWFNTLNAKNWPNDCYQSNLTLMSIQDTVHQSEDCLYLNIFAPRSKFLTRKSLLPVMVWIHGFIMDSYSDFNPIVLSIRGEVIVVTINYRLGSLGLLYSGTDDAPGNTLLWDQILALQWVQTNIIRFGGDSDRVTIFGVGVGSVSVGAHILSPVSRGLFQNAVMMSGSALTHRAVDTPEVVRNYWLNESIRIGCGSKNDYRFTPQIMNCLRRAPAERLLSMSIVVGNKIGPLFVIDGTIITKSPTQMLKPRNFKINITKTSNPGTIDGAQWRQYYSMGANIIAPYYEYTNEPKSVTNFNIGLKIDECDYLWNQYNH
ncbi:unnamed protein product, partial [Medioppia subpectinata]